MRASLAHSPLTSHQSSPQRLATLSPLTTDRHQPFEIPKTESDADGMLAAALWRMQTLPAIRLEVAQDLTRFLGASSHVWTPARRTHLTSLIVSAGREAIGAVLARVAANPREEVVDASVAVVAMAADADDLLTLGLAGALLSHHDVFEDTPIVREVMARGLARSINPTALESRLLVLYSVASTDPSPATRDAAIQTLAMIGDSTSIPTLIRIMRKLESNEKDAMVRQSISEAVETLEER